MRNAAKPQSHTRPRAGPREQNGAGPPGGLGRKVKFAPSSLPAKSLFLLGLPFAPSSWVFLAFPSPTQALIRPCLQSQK